MTSEGDVKERPKGYSLLALAQLSRAVTLFFGVVVLSRILSPDDFGNVALAVSIVGAGEIDRKSVV